MIGMMYSLDTNYSHYLDVESEVRLLLNIDQSEIYGSSDKQENTYDHVA